MGITFTDFWHAKGKLRSREVIVQDSLQELHFHIPCSNPGVLCSHSRLTDLLFTPSCLCSFVFLYVVTKTSAEGVQSPSLNTSPWYKHQSPSKSSLSRTSVGAYLTESWGHLSETLQKQRGQRAEERKGVTTPPQHHHHPLPLLCQTPLSAAPFWLFFMQFKCLNFTKQNTFIVRVFFAHCTTQQRELFCLNIIISPSRASCKFLPKIICHKLCGKCSENETDGMH